VSQQTSRKSGMASTPEKTSSTRHPFEPAPASNPVPGATGKEGTPIEGSARIPNQGRDRHEDIEDEVDK
jgi:hypothetical protein